MNILREYKVPLQRYMAMMDLQVTFPLRNTADVLFGLKFKILPLLQTRKTSKRKMIGELFMHIRTYQPINLPYL